MTQRAIGPLLWRYLLPQIGSCATALLWAANASPGQERQPAFVRLQRDDGQPVAHAEVCALGSPWLPTQPVPADRVVAVTDAQGRAQLPLLPDLEYSAWAVVPPVGTTDFRVTQVAQVLRQGSSAELRLGPARPRQRARLTGVEHWPSDLGLHITAVAIEGHVLPVSLDTDGLLPPLPEIGVFVIADRDGQVVWAGPPKPGALATRDVAMPRPQRGVVTVRGPDGKPVAGAEIRQLLSLAQPRPPFSGLGEGYREVAAPPCTHRLGATDGEGRCAFELPAWTDDLNWNLLATAPGLGAIEFGIQSGIVKIGELTYPRNKDAEGRCQFSLQLPGARRVAVPAAEGEVATVIPAYAPPMPAQVVDRAIEIPVGKPCWVRLPATGDAPVGYAHLTAKEDALPKLHEVTITVREADGRPPDRAVLTLFASHLEIPLVLDRLGRTRLRLGAERCLAFATNATAVAHAEVRPGGAAELTLELAPPALAEIQFLGADGQPLAGGTAPYGMRTSSRRSDPWFQGILVRKQQWLHQRGFGPATLDSAGWLRLPLLAPDAAIDLVPGVGGAQFDPVRLAPGKTSIQLY
ncbi:MAG: hypothetical protein JNK49_03475 [Planctomycetes bacterium]|nr:hypothetical protein [Planctomycetota bacterium]